MSLDDTHPVTTDLTEMSDGDLVLRSRSGDSAAYGELWRRHYRSGIVAARSVTSSIDPDDLVQEAYERIFQAIKRGGGPTSAFRAYLFTSIRNTAAAWGRASKDTAVYELENVEDPTANAHVTDGALDRGLTKEAFRSLPTRWQEVLWYTTIERMKPAEAAPLLGMSANAVAQLAVRAREGLREAWIQAHLRSVADGSECQYTIDKLGAYARGNLGVRAKTRVENHLADCTRCAIVASEAHEVSNRLAFVMLPLVIGAGAATAYAAYLQTGGTATVAMAAMPSTVVAGAVTATSPVLGQTGTAAVGASSTAGAVPLSGGALAAIGVTVAGMLVAGAVALGATLPYPAITSRPHSATAVQASAGLPSPKSVPSPTPPAAPTSPSPPKTPAVAPKAPVAPPAPATQRLSRAEAMSPTAGAPSPAKVAPASPPRSPSTPSRAATLVKVQVTTDHGNPVTITATVHAAPGATVTAIIRGFTRGVATADANGIATVVISPKVSDVVHNALVSFTVPGAAALEIAIGGLVGTSH